MTDEHKMVWAAAYGAAFAAGKGFHTAKAFAANAMYELIEYAKLQPSDEEEWGAQMGRDHD